MKTIYKIFIVIGIVVPVITILPLYLIPYSSLEIDKLDETYKVGESVTFLIKQEGCSIPCDFHLIEVFDENDKLVWKTGSTFSRQESWTPKMFRSFLDVITIREYENVTKKPGMYIVKYSNGELEVTQDFTVIPRK